MTGYQGRIWDHQVLVESVKKAMGPRDTHCDPADLEYDVPGSKALYFTMVVSRPIAHLADKASHATLICQERVYKFKYDNRREITSPCIYAPEL